VLAAGADPRPDARAAFARDFNGKAYATIEELCDDPQVDAVYISTPHELHAAQARHAAARGKHLLIEKPMALTLADCTAIIDAARTAGVALVAGHSHSFDAPIARARALIDSGRYGALRMIHTLNYTDWLYRPRRPEELSDGGGVIFNQAPHQVDVVRLLAGGKATSVRAHAGAWDDKRPVPAAYSALLNFENGVFASMTYSGFAHFDSDALTNWIGEGGQTKNPDAYGGARRALAGVATLADEQVLKCARIYGGSDFNEPRASPATPLKHPHFGFLIASCEGADFRPLPDGVMVFEHDKSWFDPLPPPDVPRGEVIDEFIAAIGGTPPPHGGEWSRATMEVCLAMQQSAREQREIPLKYQVGL
ncbi:MAG TPA: Gfo/Idh/MocA family oxidoreductase, partial [Xanthobacteraceae bacterium]|nr:Gfo/Idh/MocA family oxidoreductase [Xanthobacteraceae bacterium]